MVRCKSNSTRLSGAIRGLALLAAAVACLATSQLAHAQVIQQAIGGVWMDTDGVLRNVDLSYRPELRSLRLKALTQAPGDMNQPTELRMVSLSRLQDAIAACQESRHSAAG